MFAHLRWLPLLLLLAAAAPATAQPMPFEDLQVSGLRIPLAGNAVVRDAARWETLWHRFGGGRTPPSVDFTRRMVVVAALGGWPAGCSDRARIVTDVVERRDSILVSVGAHDDGAGEITCMAEVYPLHVVLLPRSRKPVAFRNAPERVPARAAWWDTPTAADLARRSPAERSVLPGAVLRDPRATLAQVLEMLDLVRRLDRSTAGRLLKRPDIRSNATAAGRVAAAAGRDEREIRAQVFDRHGVALASDRRTRADVIALLAEELRERHPRPAGIARALVRHPVVLDDQEMLRRLVFEVQSLPDVRDEGCRTYAARYPMWIPMLRSDGTSTDTWTTPLSFCGHLFPRPTHRPGEQP